MVDNQGFKFLARWMPIDETDCTLHAPLLANGPRRGVPDLAEKAHPPGIFGTTSDVSIRPSERSAVLSDISTGDSSDAMGMDPKTNKRKDKVELLLQPKPEQITPQQLIVKVETIYKDVVKFEDKAMEHTQAAQSRKPMSQEEYMSYIGLHQGLLDKYYDLFLEIQRPEAPSWLRQVPEKHFIPARMWSHGVHTPLEILRMRLPTSREHMIAFVLFCFKQMTLFLQVVPQLEVTWLECLGDLGRYRLALAENDEEKEIFSRVARDWYDRAIQLNPQISRLYHSNSILAPEYSLEQLSLFGIALTGLEPFFRPGRASLSTYDQF